MAGMPYHLEKGPMFATLEALYADLNQLPKFLRKLWLGEAAALGSLGAITSTAADNPSGTGPNATGLDRVTSMRRDWFGDISGLPQPPWGTAHPATGLPVLSTGYWAHYYGDVRQIVAQTLMRAGEVALGVDRPSTVPAAPPVGVRHWPVEFFWKCGQPRFEGWVTWRDNDLGGSGQVTVIFATPATPDQVLPRPGDGADVVPTTGWQRKWQGTWVCSHENHAQHLIVTAAPTTLGNWFVPVSTVMFTEGTGDVGTWAPKFGNGGAPGAPLAFTQGPENL